ncbi:pseudouridine synthase for 23S rRNA (position 746) and tRNAphe(position 32) [Alteromonas sp. 38]|uniref:pseudouridine synthase n=1 Tax=unclassified Alteromonas TaxID=2614992 RepID=UPI0012F1356E|nr:MULTISPECIES: pseudouridine synthase [unclassified Alteromonas]CAD5291898.1 pseudouridine synthase for 23S rRNA (position 746) and tRNAphe(position 32) [Alteromonas sp. 154]VXB18508.1 pseudouridine synthase for 23S rRNA (position 746) and tRNAphe(position 32) [Alteromonas sp. 38]
MANPAFVYNPPQQPYLTILYQDDDILVANKPSGLLSVPGKAEEHRDSLISRVNTVFPTATVVHRLDMATSGIMVMALNKESHRRISKQFELRQTKKRYFARVFGKVKSNQGEVNLPLICDWPNRPKQMVDYERGKKALTHYEVVDVTPNESHETVNSKMGESPVTSQALSPIEDEKSETLIALYPVTGRSHQLRVHMLELGHPILGDRLYAHEEALGMAERLQLHAESLSFAHPVSENWLTFQTPIPFTAYAHYSPAPLSIV